MYTITIEFHERSLFDHSFIAKTSKEVETSTKESAEDLFQRAIEWIDQRQPLEWEVWMSSPDHKPLKSINHIYKEIEYFTNN